MKIDIKLLKKPNKKLLACLAMHTVFSRAKAYLNQNQIDVLVGLSFINKDWYYVLDNINCSKQICTKLFNNEKLTFNENKFVNSALKVYRSYKKIDDVYFKLIEDYNKEVIPKFEKSLENIFTNTSISLKIVFLYQPLVGHTKGSSFRNGICFNVENNGFNKDYFYSLINHECIHSICDNNEEYTILYNLKELNLEKLPRSRNIFNETFTSTIQNIIDYKLGLKKEQFTYYRYEGRIHNDLACKMEDNIRNLYLKWDKSKSKNKGTFVNFLIKNITEIIKI